MTKKLIALAIAGMVGWATQIQAETVESIICQQALVSVPGNVPTELTHIHLDCGNWLVGGVINVFELAENGTVFLTGNIDMTVGLDDCVGKSPVTSQQLDFSHNVILNVSFPARLIQVTPVEGADVFLTVFSNMPGQPPPDAFAWGYISATQAHNN